jgi:hypothetical protein
MLFTLYLKMSIVLKLTTSYLNLTETMHVFSKHLRKSHMNNTTLLKVIPQFCIAHFYCAHLITYNFIHYTYRLKKIHFMTILCYFKTSLVTFVQRITLKSMFSKKAYKSVARVPCVCSIFIYLYFTF